MAAKTLVLSHPKWTKLSEKIKEDHGPKVFLVSWALKRNLGFSVRNYREYREKDGMFHYDIRLDFYDEMLQTMFILKYADYLEDTQDA